MKIYKITEASEYLGVSINTLKTLANNGKIKSFKTTGGSAMKSFWWHITCRAPWEKRAMLIAPQRRRTRLRIHACRYTEKRAESVMTEFFKEFPQYEFKKIKAK